MNRKAKTKQKHKNIIEIRNQFFFFKEKDKSYAKSNPQNLITKLLSSPQQRHQKLMWSLCVPKYINNKNNHSQ
jgi:hypothetical protein